MATSTKYFAGQKVIGQVTGFKEYGLFIEALQDYKPILIHATELPNGMTPDDLRDYFDMFDEVECTLVKVDDATGKIAGSLKGQVFTRKRKDYVVKANYVSKQDDKLQALKTDLQVSEKQARLTYLDNSKENAEIVAFIAEALKPTITAEQMQKLKELIAENGVFRFSVALAESAREYKDSNPIDQLLTGIAYSLAKK